MVESLDNCLKFAEVVIIGNGSEEFASVLGRLSPEQHVIDLVRLNTAPGSAKYEGIAW